MKIIVVSLGRSVERRKNMIAQLTAKGLDFEIFDAIDGDKLTEEDYNKYCDLDAIKKNSSWLNKGTIGACLSHYFIFKRIIDLNIHHFFAYQLSTVF